MLRHVLPDISALRASRDLRLVVLGSFVGGLGSQATLVALPLQIYLLTHSAFLVGLLGLVELGPLVASSLWGGAVADRVDRRRLLLLAQLGAAAGTGGLAVAAFAGHPPLGVIYALGGLLAGANAAANTCQAAMVPELVPDRRDLPAALAVDYSLSSLAMVLGPGLGGLLIAAFGVRAAYVVDASSCLAVVLATVPVTPRPPAVSATAHEPIGRSIRAGLAHVRANRALVGSFAIDLVAMGFGMPRALFAVLSVSVYHSGASGTGLLAAAVAVGAVLASASTGWLRHARRLGRICIAAVTVWGLAVAAAGAMDVLWAAAGLFAVAGAADSVSAVCRSTINQSVTPDALRGRMSSVFGLVVTGGPRLGDLESGSVAGAAGPRFSVVSGGLACLVGVVVVAFAFPELAAYSTEDWLAHDDGEPAGATAGTAEPEAASGLPAG